MNEAEIETTLTVLDDLPSDEYHRDQIAHEPSLSSSIAKILVMQSPLHAWHAHPRLNPKFVPVQNEDFDRGSAAHALLLEGEDRMVECAFNDWRTNAAKDARDEARAAGKLPLLTKHVGAVRRMVEVAKTALLESELHATLEDFHAERSVIWREDGTEVWKRARFDLQHVDRPLILDYKTVESADPWAFQRAIVSLGYDVQAAHYCDAYVAMHPSAADRVDFVFLVQEREAPFACSLVGLEPAFLELGKSKVAHATAIWADCLKDRHWPSYSHKIAWSQPPAWALTDFEARIQR
jgi:PDDEXK-like uncharacterized protein DUF3799